MRIAESELIINDDGSAFHIHLKPEELADIVILVGDPGRVDMVAGFLTDIEFRHQSREFVSTTGKYNGKRVTVLSTGIGTDNIDIVMTELDALANVDFTTREPKKEHPHDPQDRNLRGCPGRHSARISDFLPLFRGLRRSDELVRRP